MLSPLSVTLAASSDGGGSEAITFISGSGSTMVGSSPGCQRSMLLSEPPSEEFPKKRLAVLTLKPSCDGDIGPGAGFRSSTRWASSHIEISYCANGGGGWAGGQFGAGGGGAGGGGGGGCCPFSQTCVDLVAGSP